MARQCRRTAAAASFCSRGWECNRVIKRRRFIRASDTKPCQRLLERLGRLPAGLLNARAYVSCFTLKHCCSCGSERGEIGPAVKRFASFPPVMFKLGMKHGIYGLLDSGMPRPSAGVALAFLFVGSVVASVPGPGDTT